MFDSVSGEIEESRNKNAELKNSLLYTQVVQKELKNSISEHIKLMRKTVDIPNTVENIAERTRQLKDNSRKSNIVIDGISERRDENGEQWSLWPVLKWCNTLVIEKVLAQPLYCLIL